jgi:hypothetical protein
MKRILLLLALLSSVVNADIQTIKVQSLGYGISPNSAIRNALIESLRQHKGVTVDSVKSFTNNINEFSKSDNGVDSNSVEIEKSMRSKILEITAGTIQAYRIIENKKLSVNEWEAELEVTFKKYKTPGISPNSRRKLLVYPFKTSQDKYQVNEKTYKGKEFSRQLSSHIDALLVQTRRFTVLDRDYIEESLQEKQFILSADTSIQEKIKLGEKLSADYIVVGTIANASIDKKEEYLDLLDETIVERSAEFIIEYKIIVMTTGQSKWSDVVSINIDGNTMRQLSQGKTDNVIHRETMNFISKKITNALMSNIYPLKIIGVSNRLKTITINQGGNSLKNGDILDVMALGEEFFDPYSGESLGQDEEMIAKAKVTRVLPKFTKAKIISGNISDVRKNDIVRRHTTPINKTQKSNPQWIGD